MFPNWKFGSSLEEGWGLFSPDKDHVSWERAPPSYQYLLPKAMLSLVLAAAPDVSFLSKRNWSSTIPGTDQFLPCNILSSFHLGYFYFNLRIVFFFSNLKDFFFLPFCLLDFHSLLFNLCRQIIFYYPSVKSISRNSRWPPPRSRFFFSIPYSRFDAKIIWRFYGKWGQRGLSLDPRGFVTELIFHAFFSPIIGVFNLVRFFSFFFCDVSKIFTFFSFAWKF